MSALDDIVDRAIDYTNRILHTMPSYREAAVTGLRRLRDSLAQKSPAHPALRRLADYLDGLPGGDAENGKRLFADPLNGRRWLR